MLSVSQQVMHLMLQLDPPMDQYAHRIVIHCTSIGMLKLLHEILLEY